MKRNEKTRLQRYGLFAIPVPLPALLGLVFVPADAQAQNQPSYTEIEEIVVTGKRASLVSSLHAKRDAKSVVDGITAEELGLFPDANVADSLSHISGVTIDRTRGGEGKGVNIRGLGAEYSIVTMNGRLLATDAEGREFAFDVLPAEVISSAWVHKSVTAQTLEGSIGGAIDLVTAKPFDRPGMQLSGSLEAGYSNKADDNSYKFTGVFSNTFANDTVGLLLTALHSNTPVRNDEMTDLNYTENWSWDHDNDKGWVAWQDASNELRLPNTFAYGAFLEERERNAFSATLQFRPTDRLEVTVDGLYTRLDAPSTAYTASWYTIGAADRWQNVQYTGTTTDLNPQGIFVTGYEIPDFVPELVTETEYRVVDTHQLGLNAQFEASERLSLAVDVYASKATRDAGGKDLFIASHSVGAIPNLTTFSLNENGLPHVAIDFSANPDINSMADLITDEHFGPHFSQSTGVDVDDEVLGASFSGSFSIDTEPLPLGFASFSIVSLDFGLSYSDRTKERTQFDNEHARSLFAGAPFTFADTGVSVVHPVSLDGLLSEVSGDFPGVYVGFDPDAYQRALKAAENNPNIINPATGEPYPVGYSDQDEPLFDGNASFAVAEETVSAYVQANLQGERWWANLGLRHSRTSTASNGWSAPIERINLTSWGGYYADFGELTPISESNSYSKLLPSFNFGYQLTEDLLLRISAAEVMSRASMNQLSTQVDNQYLTWGEWTTLYVGNPSLAPVEAKQADIALEWYYSDDSAVTAAVFYKDIDGFIQDWQEVYPGTWDNPDRPTYPVEQSDGSFVDTPFNEFEPKNLDSATALGLELGFQHFFDNGFGITANFTKIDTESIISDSVVGVLPGVADKTYSMSLIYEREKLSVQLYANHTEAYMTSHWSPLNRAGEETYKSTVKGYTDASFSASYAAFDAGYIFIEATNLLDSAWHSLAGRPDLPAYYAEWGSRVNLGIRANF